MNGIDRRGAIATAMAGVVAGRRVHAQGAWKPSRPLTIYNPQAAGGVCDVHLRFLAERMTKIWGTQVNVDVKAGAGATLAAAQMVNVKPDGQIIACMTINSLRYPHYQTANWHPLHDFSYIIGLSEFTFGVGGTGHLLMIEAEQATGARLMHVPHKGSADWLPALLGGHIHFVADGAGWAPSVESGQVRLLAMATEKRFGKYPDKPTLIESGINAVAVSPYGLVGPKDLPQPVIQAIHDTVKEAMADPKHQPLLDQFIQEPWYRDPAQYRAFAGKYYVDVKPMLIKSGLAKA